MALSLAMAHVHLLAAFVIEILQPRVITNTRNINPNPPPGEPMTTWKMYGRACAAGASTMSASGGSVTQMGMMKKRPAMPPTGTQSEIALGTWRERYQTLSETMGLESRLVVLGGFITQLTFTDASWHSSAMLEIMPMAEKQYATGKSPMKNVNPPQPASEVS